MQIQLSQLHQQFKLNRQANIELSSYLIWNAFITLVLAPILYNIRQNSQENKRIDILLNKTREEIARDYVTKSESRAVMKDLVDRLDKLDEKLDKLFELR